MKKLALIGCGGIGGYHLEHFLQYTWSWPGSAT